MFNVWDQKGIRKLRPYVADIPINLWGTDLLQQWGTQISIPEIPGTASKEIRGDMVDTPGEVINTDERVQSQAVLMVKSQDVTEIEFPSL